MYLDLLLCFWSFVEENGLYFLSLLQRRKKTTIYFEFFVWFCFFFSCEDQDHKQRFAEKIVLVFNMHDSHAKMKWKTNQKNSIQLKIQLSVVH